VEQEEVEEKIESTRQLIEKIKQYIAENNKLRTREHSSQQL
jgi:hypothetical protein